MATWEEMLQSWYVISFQVTDEEDNSARSFAVVQAENAAAAAAAFVSALGYQGSGADEDIWGAIPDYFETMVERADGAYYITGSDFESVEEDEEPATEVVMLMVNEPEERGHRSEQKAVDAIEKQLPAFGGKILAINDEGDVSVVE